MNIMNPQKEILNKERMCARAHTHTHTHQMETVVVKNTIMEPNHSEHELGMAGEESEPGNRHPLS